MCVCVCEREREREREYLTLYELQYCSRAAFTRHTSFAKTIVTKTEIFTQSLVEKDTRRIQLKYTEQGKADCYKCVECCVVDFEEN